MAISYAKISKTQYIFRQLTSLTTEEFEKIVKKIKPEWEKEKKRHRYSVRKTTKNVRKITLEKRKQPPVDSIKYADSGYQGWQKSQKNVVIPYKKYSKKPLTEEQPEL